MDGSAEIDQDFHLAFRLQTNIPPVTSARDLFASVPGPKTRACPAGPLPGSKSHHLSQFEAISRAPPRPLPAVGRNARTLEAYLERGIDEKLKRPVLYLTPWGSGVRYNFNPRYSMAVGCSYMHVSNLFLSLPKYDDNGINACGPMAGFNMRIGKPKQKFGE